MNIDIIIFNRSAILSPTRPFLCFGAPFGAVSDNVQCSSWAHLERKRVVDLVLIELFSLGVTVTVEALRTKIDRKSAISL